MAQGAGVRARRTARRYGLVGWRGVAGMLVVLAALVALVFVAVRGRAAEGLLGGAGGVEIERAEEAGAAPVAEETEEEPLTLVVHVDGMVGAPGVYELAEGARVGDAVTAAGGLAEGADTSSLNLAAPLSDGEKVHVPAEGEATPAAPADSASGGLVNLNTASVEQLDELPGVGEATARAIIEDREANGPFTTPEDLMRVSGIGEKKFAKLEGMICV